MNLKEQLLALQKAMQAIVEGAKASNRNLTEQEFKTIEAKSAEAMELKDKIERSEKSAALLASIAGTVDVEPIGGAAGAFLALTGRGAKAASSRMAAQLTERGGQKALLAPGTQVFATPLESQSPLEIQRIPSSVIEVLRSTVRETPTWDYLRQSAFTNNAAIVAPGGTKPVSPVTIEKKTGALQVFAHLSEPVDKYLLQDNTSIADFIAGQLLYGLGRKLETEVISGDGTAGHLTGLLNVGGVQTQTAAADKVVTLRAAATKLEVLGYNTDVFILNPTDWAAIETQRATSGTFDLGGPIDRAQRRVWGTQVVTSPGVTAGKAFAMDLSAATIDRDTQGVAVEWDRSQGFKTNELIVRVEGRFGLSVYRPDAIVKITLPS